MRWVMVATVQRVDRLSGEVGLGGGLVDKPTADEALGDVEVGGRGRVAGEVIALELLLHAAIGCTEHRRLIAVNVVEHLLHVALCKTLGALERAGQQLVRVLPVLRQMVVRPHAQVLEAALTLGDCD